MLTNDHNDKRMRAAMTFLERHHNEGYEFLHRSVTDDEIWIA
jgi:hypothetical protein